jgi:hypothetical protein
MSNSPERPRQLQRLHDFMFGKGFVPIRDIYRCIYRRWPKGSTSDAQRQIGDYIRRYNRIGGFRIAPGLIKGTYYLVELEQ